jgi:hypothetical protein
MDTIDNNEIPKRRLEDHTPDAKIDWTAPGAPAVPAAPATRCTPLRAVASMSVSAEGFSFFATPAAKQLEHGHYMLSALGAEPRPAAAPAPGSAISGADMAQRLRRDHGRGITHPHHTHLCDICKETAASAAQPEAAAPAAPAVTVSPAPRVEEQTLTIETIVQLIDEHTDRDFGLIVEPFARAIERKVRSDLARQAQPTDRDAVLEEAAKEMNRVPMWSNCSILISEAQSAIRALKGKSGSEGAAE